jgi:hypothetical protein
MGSKTQADGLFYWSDMLGVLIACCDFANQQAYWRDSDREDIN